MQAVNVLSKNDFVAQELCLPPSLPDDLAEDQLITTSCNGRPIACDISVGQCWKHDLVSDKWKHFSDMISQRESAAAININEHDFWVTGQY